MEAKSKWKHLSDQEGIEDISMTLIKVGFSTILNNIGSSVYFFACDSQYQNRESRIRIFLEKRYKDDKGINQLL